jgi:hypothetical protein
MVLGGQNIAVASLPQREPRYPLYKGRRGEPETIWASVEIISFLQRV